MGYTEGLQKLMEEIEKNSPYKKKAAGPRTTMSVPEMGRMLGLKKTDRYWLVHKNYFVTKIVNGKMRVDIASFEKWYANQVKYRKIDGEEPGRELKERSYSARDIAEILDISEARAYEIIKEKHLETVTVDYWKRVPTKAFEEWYAGQSRFRNAADRERDAELEAATITMPEMARLLGIERDQVYGILRDKHYSHFFESVIIADRRRIKKDGFEKFLEAQDQYQLVDQRKDTDVEYSQNPEGCKADQAEFLSLDEAARLAGVSRMTVLRWLEKGYIDEKRIGSMRRIFKSELTEWLQQKENKTEGE